MTQAMPKPSIRRESLWVFLLFIAIYALTNQGFLVGEGGYHYRVAWQIINHGQLGFDQRIPGVFGLAPNGRYYAGHEIGNSLFMLPTAFFNSLLGDILSGHVSEGLLRQLTPFILSFQFGVYCAITVTAFFAILRAGFGLSLRLSFLSTLALGLTTFIWAYARNSYDGVLCCTLLTLSFLGLMLYKHHRHEVGAYGYLLGAFLCLGFAFITRISMVLPIWASLLYVGLIHRDRISLIVQRVGLAIAILIPFGVWQMWYNHLRTGMFSKSPVQTEQYANNNALDGNILVGLTGLLASPGKSLFIYAPLLILSVILARKFYREHRKEGIYLLVLTVMWFLLHARLRSWYGAWGWGPRHFLIVLPLFMLPFAVNLELIFKTLWLRILGIALTAFGLFFTLCSIISNWHFRMAHARDDGRIQDAIFVWGWTDNQAIDMIKGGLGNLWRIITSGPPIVVSDEYSPANEYVSSTLTVWPNALFAAGIPWYVAIAATLPLWLLLGISLWRLMALHRQQTPSALAADPNSEVMG